MVEKVTPHPRRWWALAVIALAQFMVIMDTSIIGVALPKMQVDLGFSQANLSWVFNAYVVAFGGLLLLGGKLSDLFGARRVFSTGWAVLLAGSVVAALAGSAWVLRRVHRRRRHRRRRRTAGLAHPAPTPTPGRGPRSTGRTDPHQLRQGQPGRLSRQTRNRPGAPHHRHGWVR